MKYAIIMGILVVLIVLMLIIKKIITNKKIKQEIENIVNKNNWQLETKNSDCDYLIKTENKNIKIVVAKIPSNSSVTINSKTTWCLRWGGSREGRSYPNQRYMNELIKFLNMKSDDIKLIVLYPEYEKLQRYLNESEIALVGEKEKVYDYYVVKFNSLDKWFSDLN